MIRIRANAAISFDACLVPAPHTVPMPKPIEELAWHLQHGHAAERMAAHYLQAQGLVQVAQNERSRVGEIDLVFLDGRELVIVEVRQRRSAEFGGALASVSRWKQRKIARATQIFLQRAPHWAHLPVRFDVVAVNGLPHRDPQIEWVKHAF